MQLTMGGAAAIPKVTVVNFLGISAYSSLAQIQIQDINYI